MKYFLDTEFHEYKLKTYSAEEADTIELISIGIVAEDGRGYYAVAKDFNISKAWSNQWLRDNVLINIHAELLYNHINRIHPTSAVTFDSIHDTKLYILGRASNPDDTIIYNEFGWLIENYGKSNKQIAEEIYSLINPDFGFYASIHNNFYSEEEKSQEHWNKIHDLVLIDNVPYAQPKFYGYYCDYDWVVFCWLFGRMNDLPKGFPMYCVDLKQTLDEKEKYQQKHGYSMFQHPDGMIEGELGGLGDDYLITQEKNYPQQTNEHHSLHDAKWTFELHKFLQTI